MFKYIESLEKRLQVLGAHISMCPCDFDAIDEYESIEAELKDLRIRS